MEDLNRRLTETLSLEPSIAKAAIGHVLLFLRDQAPGGHIDEFIDKTSGAREAVAAASATGDGGVTQIIEGFGSLLGQGRADLNILAGKLANLGLTQEQCARLIDETLTRTQAHIGEEGVEKIRSIMPALAERMGPMGKRPEPETRPRA